MCNLSWHECSIIFSSFAAIAGIVLLTLYKQPAKDEIEASDHMLMLMTFAYWLVYCAAFGLQKVVSPEWDIVILSLRLTGVISFLLSASCILSLPLNRVAIRQPE